MAVDINKLEFHDKSVHLLNNNAKNIFKNMWILRCIKKGKI